MYEPELGFEFKSEKLKCKVDKCKYYFYNTGTNAQQLLLYRERGHFAVFVLKGST